MESVARAPGAGDPFEALGDAHRREILRLLSEGDKPVGEIAAALPISRPAVSRHLRLLKDAGLVAEQAQGTRRIYHLQDQGIQAVQAYLERVWGEAALRFRLLAENTQPAEPRPAESTQPAPPRPAGNTQPARPLPAGSTQAAQPRPAEPRPAGLRPAGNTMPDRDAGEREAGEPAHP